MQNRKARNRKETLVGKDTTGADSRFSFPRLPEDTYVVRTDPLDQPVVLYSGLREGVSFSTARVPNQSIDLVTSFVTLISKSYEPRERAARIFDESDEYPTFDHRDGAILDRNGFSNSTLRPRDETGQTSREKPDADFVVLYRTSTISGTVTPTAMADSARSLVISVLRCQVTNFPIPDDTCTGFYDPVGIHVEPEKGKWTLGGLLEGQYEVRIAVSSDYVVKGDWKKLVKVRSRDARGTANFEIEEPS